MLITLNRMSRWSTFMGKFSNISVVIFFCFSIEFSWKAFKPVRHDLTASKPISILLLNFSLQIPNIRNNFLNYSMISMKKKRNGPKTLSRMK